MEPLSTTGWGNPRVAYEERTTGSKSLSQTHWKPSRLEDNLSFTKSKEENLLAGAKRAVHMQLNKTRAKMAKGPALVGIGLKGDGPLTHNSTRPTEVTEPAKKRQRIRDALLVIAIRSMLPSESDL